MPLELTAVQCCGILSVLEMLHGTLYVSNEQSLTNKSWLESLIRNIKSNNLEYKQTIK